mgnify:CR=1 FL=1
MSIDRSEQPPYRGGDVGEGNLVRTPEGREVGPEVVVRKGRGKPHRKDRPWTMAWSPEQIANRLKVDFPDDESMRISHEAIYQALSTTAEE